MITNQLPVQSLLVVRIPSQAIHPITNNLQAHSLLVRRNLSHAIRIITIHLQAHFLLVRRKILRLYFWAGSGVNEIIYTAGRTGLRMENP